MPIYTSKNIIIPYAIHPFNICLEHPEWWKNIKIAFILTYIISNIIILNTIYTIIIKIKNKQKNNKTSNKKYNTKQIEEKTSNQLAIYVGKNEKEQLIYIPENGLYQNILITRNNWKWKNKFLYVSIHKTINTIQKSRHTGKNRNANTRCKRKLL